MEIEVKITQILATQRFTSKKNGNEYIKNSFVGQTNDQSYPKTICFEVMGEERWQQMGIMVGGMYQISFDVESRQWQDKWFTQATAWRAVRIDGGNVVGMPQQQQPQQQTAYQQAQQVYAPQPQQAQVSDDDLPF